MAEPPLDRPGVVALVGQSAYDSVSLAAGKAAHQIGDTNGASLLGRDTAAGLSNSGGPNGLGPNVLRGRALCWTEIAVFLLKYK
jgi:hypothetical protein